MRLFLSSFAENRWNFIAQVCCPSDSYSLYIRSWEPFTCSDRLYYEKYKTIVITTTQCDRNSTSWCQLHEKFILPSTEAK